VRHSHDQEIDPEVVAALLAGLEGGHAGVCLSDSEDYVRYVNPAFRAVFFPNAPNVPFEFTEALANAINAGMGIKLNSMSLEDFVPRVRERRRSGSARYDFSVDMIDGTWWWVNDHRLPNGWTLVVATEISSLKEEEFRLRAAHSAAVKETQVDALTGTRSRKYGLVQAQLDLERHLAYEIPFTLAILDINHFKRINDTFGHMVGDEVLTHFAQALATRLSPHDHVTRLGGEEFLVTMSSTSEEMALARLERLIRSLTPLEMGANQPELKYSFSAGIALARGPDTVNSLLGRADAALYEAKHGGRGKVCVARAPKIDAA
jgi:diguanylate cyclase (GGDEF)-like protein